MFHVEGGLYFERLEGGGVRITQKESANQDAPTVTEMVLDEASWCSVISSMSKYGECNDGFYRARHFHNMKGNIRCILVNVPNNNRKYHVAVLEGTRACDIVRSEEHTSELQSHSFISYAVFCLKKKNNVTVIEFAISR